MAGDHRRRVLTPSRARTATRRGGHPNLPEMAEDQLRSSRDVAVRTPYDLRHAVVSTWLPHVGPFQARGRTAAEQDGQPLAYRSAGPLLSTPSVRS
jgi:hypothetical protein